jgi:hypothetical protein
LKLQRLSNNRQPAFTDQQLATLYLFGHLRGHFSQRRIYDYITRHWLPWFPDLPSYQACNYRLNLLSPSFARLLQDLLTSLAHLGSLTTDHVIDSLPIILAKGTRADTAKVANKGYCLTKKLYYHGVKLHLLGRKRVKQLPIPERPALSDTSCLPADDSSSITFEIHPSHHRFSSRALTNTVASFQICRASKLFL